MPIRIFEGWVTKDNYRRRYLFVCLPIVVGRYEEQVSKGSYLIRLAIVGVYLWGEPRDNSPLQWPQHWFLDSLIFNSKEFCWYVLRSKESIGASIQRVIARGLRLGTYEGRDVPSIVLLTFGFCRVKSYFWPRCGVDVLIGDLGPHICSDRFAR